MEDDGAGSICDAYSVSEPQPQSTTNQNAAAARFIVAYASSSSGDTMYPAIALAATANGLARYT